MDRCDSHTQSNHLATATLRGKRIISAFHVKCALMKLILFSTADKKKKKKMRIALHSQ